MSLFTIRPGIETNAPGNISNSTNKLPEEAGIHAICSAIATDYVKYIKKNVLSQLKIPQKYTIRDLQVLIDVFESDEQLTSADIVKTSGLDPATVARSVKILKHHKHLETKPNPNDSRSLLLQLSPEGQSLAKDYIKISRTVFQQSGLSSKQQNSTEISIILQILRDFRRHSQKLRNFKI